MSATELRQVDAASRAPIAVSLAFVKNAARLYWRWSKNAEAGRLTCFDGYEYLRTDREKRHYLRARLAIIRRAFAREFIERAPPVRR